VNGEYRMSGYSCFLLTILYHDTLLKVALKVQSEALTGDCDEFPMEAENRKQLWDLLPEHVQSCGKIVDVESIFEVTVKE
jgi:hypothetical protein